MTGQLTLRTLSALKRTCRLRTCRLSLATLAFLSLSLLASTSVSAQAVQLPTIGFFNVNTTVSVPDGGRSHLGGISGYGRGFTSRGAPGLSHLPIANRGFRNQAIGNSNFAHSTGVTVKIISLREQEAEVLAEAARRRAIREREVNPNGSASTQRRAAFINRHIGRKKR